MIPLPAQETSLFFILALVTAVVASLLAILLKKTLQLDRLKDEFAQRESMLNKKLYETSVTKTKFEAMVQSLSEGVFMVDEELRLIIKNTSGIKMLKLERDQKLTIFDLVRAFDGFYPIEEKISEVFKTGKVIKDREVGIRGGVYSISLVPIEVAEDVPGVGILLHDESSSGGEKSSNEHLAMLIHELRSPLTVVKGMSDMMIENGDNFDTDKREELLTQMKNSAINMLDIVNEILEDKKESTQEFKIRKRKNNINKLLRDEVSNYTSIAMEKELQLSLDLDTEIEPFGFDMAKITQVMNNLLSNALKFTETGGVKIKSESMGDRVKISVADTGIGIPDNKKDRLFKKFVQLGNGDEEEIGTGLGLAISKSIVSAHGGEIWIEDNKPQGAKFIFTLPLS